MNNIYIKALLMTSKWFIKFVLILTLMFSVVGGIIWFGHTYGPLWGIGGTAFFVLSLIFYAEYKYNLKEIKYDEWCKGKFDE